MKHLIQFPSGRYFTDKGDTIGNWNSVFSTINLLEANMYDDIKIAKQIMKGTVPETKIISITAKDLFRIKLGARCETI